MDEKKQENEKLNFVGVSEQEDNFPDKKASNRDELIIKGLMEVRDAVLTDRREKRDHEDTFNKRGVAFAGLALLLFSAMWFTAIFLGEIEITNMILYIMLAVFAGAGGIKLLGI